MHCFAAPAPLVPFRATVIPSSCARPSLPSSQPSRLPPARMAASGAGTPPTAWPSSAWPGRSAWPAQKVLSPLPRLYIFDHCPFSARVRYTLGVKNVKHEPVWLLSDDASTGTALVGRKVVPIFQAGGAGAPAIAESLDICRAIDADERYGPTGVFRPASGRTDVGGWFGANRKAIGRLWTPRILKAQFPEHASRDARADFVRRHPMEEPAGYEENFRLSAKYIAELQPRMQELDDLIFSVEFCTKGGLSFDDIELFPRLRALTLIKDLVMPEKMQAYITHHSNLSDLAVYHVFAT